MLEWLIVGGGIQGCTLATYLLRQRLTTTRQMAIIDPYAYPLASWKRCTHVIGMPFLRSPVVHHLDVESFSLMKYAKTPKGRKYAEFLSSYDRPSLTLFNQHCDEVFHETSLFSSWVQGRAKGLEKKDGVYTVTLENEKRIQSKRIVLAMGVGEHPLWPDWALEAKENRRDIAHVFDKDTQDLSRLRPPIVIVGGGISAAHAAIRLSKEFPGKVTLLTRHSLRVYQFDSDPGWLGPKHMTSFSQIRDMNERRSIIQQARYRGSMPSELHTSLSKLQKKGTLTILYDEVSAVQRKNREMNLSLVSGTHISACSVLLATGFQAKPPGIEWLEKPIENMGLKCAQCGYPVVSPDTLEWGPNLFVMGALAELEIGPVARNIAGARRAAERITQTHRGVLEEGKYYV